MIHKIENERIEQKLIIEDETIDTAYIIKVVVNGVVYYRASQTTLIYGDSGTSINTEFATYTNNGGIK